VTVTAANDGPSNAAGTITVTYVPPGNVSAYSAKTGRMMNRPNMRNPYNPASAPVARRSIGVMRRVVAEAAEGQLSAVGPGMFNSD